jgi:hypothetical protein
LGTDLKSLKALSPIQTPQNRHEKNNLHGCMFLCRQILYINSLRPSVWRDSSAF